VKRFAASTALVLAVDQFTKWVATQYLVPDDAPPRTVRLIGDLVRFAYVRNAGGIFGVLQGSRAFFILLSLVSIGAIVALALTRRFALPGGRIAFGVVLGGALGNLVDRLSHRFVIDFIDIGIGNARWPTFNVADIGVTLGVIYLAIRLSMPSDRATRAQEASGEGCGQGPPAQPASGEDG